jgi:hypothetical protein
VRSCVNHKASERKFSFKQEAAAAELELHEQVSQ